MPDDRLPLKIHKTPGGGYIRFANGIWLLAYDPNGQARGKPAT